MKFALLGYGYWGKKIASILEKKGEVIIIDPLYSKSNENILNNSSISSVFIAAPEESHYFLAKKYLLANKNVFIEKPLCLNSVEASELVEIAQQKKLKLFVDYIFLYDDAIKEIKKILKSGILGEIYELLSIRHSVDIYKPNIHVTDDLAIHDIYIIQYLLDAKIDNTVIHSVKLNKKSTVEAQVTYKVKKIEVNSTYSWISKVKKRELSIRGTKGEVVWNTKNELIISKFEEDKSITIKKVQFSPKNSPLEQAINEYLTKDFTDFNQLHYTYIEDTKTLSTLRNDFSIHDE